MMAREIKRAVFMFSHLDYRAMEEYFEEMASNGWMIEKLGVFTATFRKIAPQNLKFTVDIFPYTTAFDSPNTRKAREYRQLCEQSGWSFVTSANKLNIFYANAADDPTPIQTDSIVEEKIVRQSVFGTEFLFFIICLPMLMMRLGALFPIDYSRLFTNTELVLTVFWPILLIPIIIYTGYYLLWFIKSKRNIRAGLPLPHSSLAAARFRGLLMLYVAVFLIALVLMAAVADARGGNFITLYAFILPTIAAAAGLWLRKRIATKERSRKQNIKIFAIVVVGIAIVFNGLTIWIITSVDRGSSLIGRKNELSEGYIALTLSDFGLEQQPRTASFTKTSSIVVPQTIDYYESSKQGTIRTRYIQTISPRIARYILDGMLKRSDLVYSYSISPASAHAWGVDEAYYLRDDRSMIILLKGDAVIYLDSKFDLGQTGLIEMAKAKLQLE